MGAPASETKRSFDRYEALLVAIQKSSYAVGGRGQTNEKYRIRIMFHVPLVSVLNTVVGVSVVVSGFAPRSRAFLSLTECT